MKTKSISFAEVLRKNTKSPRVEMTKTSMRLEEMVRKFEVDPEDDYTLYLGNFNASQRSKTSPFQMTFSRNTVQNQDEMFDSWIQKQSTIGSNKENIRNQPQRIIRNESSKLSMGAFGKNVTHSKAKQETFPSNSTTSNRQKNSKAFQQSQRNFVPLNIEMVKSNGYQNEQTMNRVKSPKNQKKNMQAQPISINMNFDQPKNNVFERPNQIKVEPTFKEIKESKESQKVQNQFIKLPQKTNEYISYPKEQTNQYFQGKKSRQHINEITNKYQNVEYSPEAEDDDLLLQFPNPQFQKNEVFDEAYTQKAQQNDEIMKKRMEEAKNKIGNYLYKFKKERQQTENEKMSDIYLNNPHFESSNNQVNAPNHMVGYSFSTNFNGVNQSSQNQQNHHQNYIPDVVSQAASESQQPLNDSNFKNKYLNMKSYQQVQHNQHIQNIQSVKYNGDYNQQNAFEHEQLYAIPNDTFRVQLITSKDNQNAKNQQYNFIQLSAPKEEPFQNKITGSYESNLLESEGTKTKAHGKSKQKISLMSNKSRNEKSNKTSPTATNQPEKQPDFATTDFAIDIPKEVKQPEKDFIKINEKSYIEQYNKTEEKMSYNLKKNEEYQYNFKDNDVPKDTKMSISGSSGFNSYPIKQPEKTITTNTTQYIPFEQKKFDDYQVPTYANIKATSKLAQITSDYYSTRNYTHYTPSYETGRHYEPPSYGNTAKDHFVGSKTYEKMPLKVENPYIYDLPKEQPKKQYSYATPTSCTPSSTDSYEHKYAHPTSYASSTDKQINKNYLQKLDIKESITFEESKTKQENANTTNQLKSSSSNYIHTFANNAKQFRTVNPVTNPRVSLKLSLKQSINVSQSEEFVFDI